MITADPTPVQSPRLTPILALLFFLSGFSALLYQLVWLRLAFASFGIVTAVVSIVVAVFMLGLSVGSWIGGNLVGPLIRRTHRPAIEFYGLSECLIGLGAFAVPMLFDLGEQVLLGLGESDSFLYVIGSAAVLGVSLLPWCFLMGTTFPFMMGFIKQIDRSDTDGFSFLYAANVLGAIAGAGTTAFILIEILGFRHTLWVAGIANFLIGATSFAIGRFAPVAWATTENQSTSAAGKGVRIEPLNAAILFLTGFTSLAMEVVWTRAYTPILGTQVYGFALLLFVYLLATRMGSVLYRKHLRYSSPYSMPQLLALLSVAAFLPLAMNDPQITSQTLQLSKSVLVVVVMLSLFPFCSMLGYLTPQLIDTVAQGDPTAAGKAYAINILGCIIGPLVAAYGLLPQLGAHYSLALLALPFSIFFGVRMAALTPSWRWPVAVAGVFLLTSSAFYHRTYEDPRGRNSEFYMIRRDHTATVTSLGQGMEKRLFVNGVGITYLTPITKFMAHLPLGFFSERARSALVVCFGMGTTYRSLLSWDIYVIGVELVPSVKDAFVYYYDDASEVLRDPNGQIIIDDGRRFLKRTKKHFDVITIDPPPPVEAAGSSLLYTEEFYQSVKQHLTPNGVLQQWFPGEAGETLHAVARSLVNQFPYVRVYPSIEGWGYHFLASMRPLAAVTSEQIVERMPMKAQKDLLEWHTSKDLRGYFDQLLSQEIPIARLLSSDTAIRIVDDRPLNEYFLLRRLFTNRH